MAEIRYGDHFEVTELAWQTVSEIREQFRSEFGIPDNAKVKLNGSKIKANAETVTMLNENDKLTFAVPRSKGLYMIGAFLLALAITGGVFAYGFINGTTTISATTSDSNFADVVVTGNMTGWTAYGNHKGTIDNGGIFEIQPASGYTGDLVVSVGLGNAGALSERYRVLSLQLQLLDASDNTTKIDINGDGSADDDDWVMLTLNNGEVAMFPDGSTDMTVNIKSGFYITHVKGTGAWGGSAAPELFCEVAQR